jgi:FixJ family two-component response regulator
MVDPNPIVIVIDDDAVFRRSTERLILSVGYKVQTFAAAGDFLLNPRPEAPACVLLDVRLPGLSGLDLQRELVTAGIQIPIIFITGHGDIPMSVQAMKAGAVGFLTKPFRQLDLLDAVQQAIGRDRAARDLETKLASLRACYKLLTPREREVTACVVLGMLNKQIAAELGTTEKTIKFHRGHIMHKMMAKSLAGLVRMAVHLGLPGQRS